MEIKKYRFIACSLLCAVAMPLLMSCAGPDYLPVYFPQKGDNNNVVADESKDDDSEDGSSSGASCTVKLTEASICVAIKRDALVVGADGEEPLCADIEDIPIEISGGSNVVLRGDTFPTIPFEGHGLPAPIQIDGKGKGDGKDNIASGKVDAAGNMTIEGFSLFINALGMVGEVPDLVLTTGETEELPELPVISGSPIAGDGSTTIVAGTIIPHLFPAADEKLLGGSIQATFSGVISPPFSQCKGSSGKPEATFVTKMVIDETGVLTEALLPGGNKMEIGSAFISEGPQDVGPKFESVARFKVVNATSKPLSINIPAVIGPFYMEPEGDGLLKQQLAPKSVLNVKISFRPSTSNVPEAGDISESLTIGTDVYQLTAHAAISSGEIGLGVSSSEGVEPLQDRLSLGDVMVSTTGKRAFFMCQSVGCDGGAKPTSCVPCVDVLSNMCQLLPVDADGEPVGVVDSSCKPVKTEAADASTIGLGKGGVTPSRQVVEVKNTGVSPMKIEAIEIIDAVGSKSAGQFSVSTQFALPYSIAPFEKSKETFVVTVIYEPSDLLGSDGSIAAVGHPVKDKAMLRIVTDSGSRTIDLVGVTEVKQTPSVEVFFKTSTGTKQQTDGSEFAFRGVGSNTKEIAVPLFVKLSDSASSSVRITKITVDQGSGFEWLDSKSEINSKTEDVRCAIPITDASGNMTGRITDLAPVDLSTSGFDLTPGKYSVENMPLFGCVNFRLGDTKQRMFRSKVTISMQEISSDGSVVRNPDGSLKQTSVTVGLLAVVNPIKGKIVFRLTQTMAAIMNPQSAFISAAASKDEMDMQIEDGMATENDRFVMPGAVILDPFDEETIKDESGAVLSLPGDGVTAVYRKVDTRPVPVIYDDPLLDSYANLIFDANGPDGQKGVFFDYPNIPDGLRSGGLKIFTASLSYPGPLATSETRPENVSLCQEVDPCDEKTLHLYGEGPTDKTKRGVCSFFYATAGAWESPAFHRPGETPDGERQNFCKTLGKPQKIKDLAGYYNLNGNLIFPNVGLRLWGPTYLNNPSSPLGDGFGPLDAVIFSSFTTGVLKPPSDESEPNAVPDKRVDFSKQEHKINLTDPSMGSAKLCAKENIRNRKFRNEFYSTWKYLAPLLVKDEEGKVPAGCPEPDNKFDGGTAFLRGRPMDQETGIATFVTSGKFESDKDLTFAFKDVMVFLVLNGWMCDPNGSEENFEGTRCFDNAYNERDALSAISIMK